jgi:hypothetical protein
MKINTSIILLLGLFSFSAGRFSRLVDHSCLLLFLLLFLLFLLLFILIFLLYFLDIVLSSLGLTFCIFPDFATSFPLSSISL